MSECSLCGRGQGHANNFYIVDLEHFATASRWYTGDIHNSVRSRFVYDNGSDSIASWLSGHVYCTSAFNFITSISSGLVVQAVSALLRGILQDFN